MNLDCIEWIKEWMNRIHRLGTSWAATCWAKTANRIVARTRSFYLYRHCPQACFGGEKVVGEKFSIGRTPYKQFLLPASKMTTRLIPISTTTLDTSVFKNRWFGNIHGYRKQSCRSKVRWNLLIPSLQILMTSWVALDVNWPSTRIIWTSIRSQTCT